MCVLLIKLLTEPAHDSCRLDRLTAKEKVCERETLRRAELEVSRSLTVSVEKPDVEPQCLHSVGARNTRQKGGAGHIQTSQEH